MVTGNGKMDPVLLAALCKDTEVDNFLRWLAYIVTSEGNAESGMELICRKLWRMGYVIKVGKRWKEAKRDE